MKISVNEKGTIILEEVYNAIVLKTNSGEEMRISMRDSGFEFGYGKIGYSAQDGEIMYLKGSMKMSLPDTVEAISDVNNNTFTNGKKVIKEITKGKKYKVTGTQGNVYHVNNNLNMIGVYDTSLFKVPEAKEDNTSDRSE